MISMTGFCSLSKTIMSEQGVPLPFVGTLKSVNSRYFEAHCKLPSLLYALENELTTQLRTSLMRGKCSIFIHAANPALLKQPMTPNINDVQAYLQALADIQQATGLQGSITIADIARSQEFFSAQEIVISESMKRDFFNFVDELISGLIDSRVQEGKALQEDILARTQTISHTIELLKEESHRYFKHKESLIHQQLEQISVAKETEVVRYQLNLELTRADVTEEIVRFETHLKSLIATTKSQTKEKGKQLDFILQELGREVNTIGAKSASTLLSTLVISLKVELEKIREQVQNIV